MTVAALLIGVGLLGGFLAGFLGLGGSILLAPLLLWLLPLLEIPAFSVHAVASISLLYLALATGAAILLRPAGRVDRSAAWWLGPAAGGAALLGGLLSARLSAQGLLILFAMAATLATVQLLAPRNPRVEPRRHRWGWAYAGGVAVGTGLVTGGVGAAGGFLLEPLLQRLLGLTARAAPATSIRIVLISAGCGLLGKVLTGQINLAASAEVLAGALPAAWWGGELAAHANPRTVRWVALTAAAAASFALWVIVAPDLIRRFHPSYLYLVALLAGGLVPIWVGMRVYRGFSLRGPYLRPSTRGGSRAQLVVPIFPEELRRLLLEGPLPQVVDVRTPEEVVRGLIPGAVNIPFDQFEGWLQAAGPADGTVIVCRNGELSQAAGQLAARYGCKVRCLTGGMEAWPGPVEPV